MVLLVESTPAPVACVLARLHALYKKLFVKRLSGQQGKSLVVLFLFYSGAQKLNSGKYLNISTVDFSNVYFNF